MRHGVGTIAAARIPKVHAAGIPVERMPVPAAAVERAKRERQQARGDAKDEAEDEHGREWVHCPTPPTWYIVDTTS
jgi:hypothetical protein